MKFIFFDKEKGDLRVNIFFSVFGDRVKSINSKELFQDRVVVYNLPKRNEGNDATLSLVPLFLATEQVQSLSRIW